MYQESGDLAELDDMFPICASRRFNDNFGAKVGRSAYYCVDEQLHLAVRGGGHFEFECVCTGHRLKFPILEDVTMQAA